MRKLETLKKNYEFKNVLSKGKYYKGNLITVYVKKNNKDKNIIGIAISSKSANAVQRNRIKRLIRENYKAIKNNLILGNDIVFLLNKNVKKEEISFHNINKDIFFIFDKLNILK